MSKKTDDIAAFPQNPDVISDQEMGMSLRDYFAAKAMQAIIAASGSNGYVDYTEDTVAASAYDMADAMMKEHNK